MPATKAAVGEGSAKGIRRWVKRHPRLAFALYLIVTATVASEIVLRVVTRFDPGYYVAYREPRPGVTLSYPYGEIPFNSHGFPDGEFPGVKTRPRIGYFGDSVCFGVGAGYGHRISELLEAKLGRFDHLNFSWGLAAGITDENRDKIVELAREFELDAALYLFNLNDLLPDDAERRSNRLLGVKRWLAPLRGRSYLYAYAHRAARTAAMRRSIGVAAQPSYELFPDRYREIIEQTARRIDRLEGDLEGLSVPLVVFLVPYEMQISEEAAKTYRQAGIRWQEEFLRGRTQQLLVESLQARHVLDGRFAFLDGQDPERSRKRWAVGEAFVYNRGDRLDWNHPNRIGHRKLAEQLAASDFFPSLSERLDGAGPEGESERTADGRGALGPR